MTTTRRPAAGAAFLGLLVLVLPACQSACPPCTRTGLAISAAVRTTHITAPPGGGSRQFLEIVGSSFTANAPIRLSFRQYPSNSQDTFDRGSAADASGHFTWTEDLHTLPPRNFNADETVDVWITAKETTSSCFAMTSIKTKAILHPPL
jgi:hypothetical protein